MAKKQVTVYTDDISGAEVSDAQTMTFAFEGQRYEIDLGKNNADAFRAAMKPYLKAARKATAAATTSTTLTRKTKKKDGGASRSNLAQVREWAAANGLKVSDRGRISASITQAYDAAH